MNRISAYLLFRTTCSDPRPAPAEILARPARNRPRRVGEGGGEVRAIRLLICGGRSLDSASVFNWLEAHAWDEIRAEAGMGATLAVVIHGGAHGADEGAAQWGASENIPVHCFPADWRKYGKAAGPIRNQKMLTEANPDLVIAFAGGRGTDDMVTRAKFSGIPVMIVKDLMK